MNVMIYEKPNTLSRMMYCSSYFDNAVVKTLTTIDVQKQFKPCVSIRFLLLPREKYLIDPLYELSEQEKDFLWRHR